MLHRTIRHRPSTHQIEERFFDARGANFAQDSVVDTIEKTRDDRKDGGLEGLHVIHQQLDVSLVETNAT